MRTNIEIDDELLDKAMELSELPTKKAVVEAGLRALIWRKRRELMLTLPGKIEWVGDLDEMGRDDLPSWPYVGEGRMAVAEASAGYDAPESSR